MHVLLIDDDINLCKVLSHQLRKNDFNVTAVHTGTDGLREFKQNSYDIVLTDMQLPDISGIEVLRSIRKKEHKAVIIMITAYGSVENALEACRTGADDYITKPFGQEQLLFVIEKAVRLRELQSENIRLQQELDDKFRFDNMIVHSPAMKDVVKMAKQVSISDANVLILGESGTGKELMARAIHYNSPRKDKPLVTVNCPSIPENLIESELFGHVKGAFTGAIKDKKGKFELADGGTIFLDEIADLKESTQAKLLRVLQEQEIEAVGGEKKIVIDVRVIAATNKDLYELVRSGEFREDLYYRLNVIPIQLPPLRERKEDIRYLVELFLARYGKGEQYSIDLGAFEILNKYHWPGNIRELENVIERAVVISSEKHISEKELSAHLKNINAAEKFFDNELSDNNLSLKYIEKRAIKEALQRSNSNQTEAAKMLEIPRHVLLYRMKKYNIKK